MKEGELDETMARIAMAVGILGLLYSIAFVLITRLNHRVGVGLSAFLLLLGGLLTSLLNAGLYLHLRKTHETIALCLLMLGSFAAFGALTHGGYDLANAIHQPTNDVLDISGYPSAIDPRGLLTFGLAGIVIFGWTWLKARSEKNYHTWFVYMGYTLAALLMYIFLGRLVILDADSPWLAIPAAIIGLVLNPWWYIWLGRHWKDWS